MFVCAIDGAGNELGRTEFNPNDKDGAEKAAQFVKQYAPNNKDAQQKWEKAFAEAKRTNRKVWDRIQPEVLQSLFFAFAARMDDQKEVLDQDYVMLKIDNFKDANGIEVAKRLTKGRNFGIPFSGIFDANENLLCDSEGPTGNFGFPSSFEGVKHLKKMLTQTRIKMTDEQIDQLMESFKE